MMVTNSINESLNEAYGDRIGTGLRNMFSWRGKGTIPPKTYAAARDFGRAFRSFKQAWDKYTPFLGDDPNAANYVAAKELQNLEKAIKTLPRLAGVQNIERPTRQELIGKYYVSDKNHQNIVNQKAQVLSKQQIDAAKQQISILQQEIYDLNINDQRMNTMVNQLMNDIADLEQQSEFPSLHYVEKEQIVAKLEENIVNLEREVVKLQSDASVDKAKISNLETTLQNVKRFLKNARKRARTEKANHEATKQKLTGAM